MNADAKIRVLVVGGGSIGERHARCFLRTGRCDVSLCELNDELRSRLQGEYALCGVFCDYGEALRAGVDVVVICTPAQLHVSMAIAAIEAGADVLIEKPLSVSLEDVDRLIALRAEKDAKVGIAYVYRAHPALTAMKRAIDSGRFGKVLQLISQSGQNFPFYRPAYRDTYYASHASGGGAIQDALTHLVNAGEWLVGPMQRLVVDAAHLVTPGVEVEDTVHLMGRQGSRGEVLVSYAMNQHQAANESRLTVICEQGTVRFEMHANRWLSCSEPGQAWHEEMVASIERDDLFVLQAEAFLDHVAGKCDVLCPVEDAAQTLKVNLAALASAEAGRWQEVNT